MDYVRHIYRFEDFDEVHITSLAMDEHPFMIFFK